MDTAEEKSALVLREAADLIERVGLAQDQFEGHLRGKLTCFDAMFYVAYDHFGFGGYAPIFKEARGRLSQILDARGENDFEENSSQRHVVATLREAAENA